MVENSIYGVSSPQTDVQPRMIVKNESVWPRTYGGIE